MSEDIAIVLEKAADRLSKKGAWGQGVVGSKAKGTCCAQLAIMGQRKLIGREPADEAEAFFAKFIGGNMAFHIWDWNDAPERTQAEVVAKLREAAAKARGEP